MIKRCFILFSGLVLVVMSAGMIGAQEAAPRHFHLGFTPFPYDISLEAVHYTYETIATNADMIVHHLDNGVPWVEALSGAPFSDHLMNDWDDRMARTPDGMTVFLTLTPISINRDGLAPYRGTADDMPLPSPWDSYAFNDPDVKTAFLNYVLRAVDFFHPDYLAIGIESNLLLNKAPEKWDAYLELHQYVYTEVKARYPDLPVMATLFGLSFLDGYRSEDNHADQMAALDQIMPYSDFFALSLYPYMSRYMTGPLPPTLFDALFSLSDKPLAISETGYPAQTFSLFNGTLTFESTPEKQAAYIESLLAEADARQMVFVNNFILRDYDALWEKIGGGDLATVWRDTGLFDEDGSARLALDVWRAALARPYEPATPQ
ncbi:MAG: hypothetical protein K8I60_04495 [Anaerolineae bacterium]|nr:hypothetical protein [Anaerolineae bacterium]